MTRLTIHRRFRAGGAVVVALMLTARVAAAGDDAPGPSPSPGASLNFLHGAAADPRSGQAWPVSVFFNTSGVSQTLTEFHP